VDFVKNPLRDHIADKGYQNKYGLKTFTDYLLWIRSYNSSTPALVNTPEQPVTALKDAIDIMADYLEALDTDEWMGLATYDDSSRVEVSLTSNLQSVASRMQQLSAGYYSRNTNIGGGMSRGRTILTSGGRPNARKTMVVMTDGLANVGGGGMSPSDYVIYQAQQAAAEGITIHTVSFTYLADQALMAQVASIGKGMHFHVPNYSVEQYTEDLEEVFRTISSMRPLVLSE
jgi:hypothetical protein